jgi:uncharacterized circularly permuted ATP-grasp superfamily protein
LADVLRENIVPEELILRNPYYRPEMIGRRASHDIWMHIAGIDIVRVGEDAFYVLEDNARTPSGVSYMLENREVTMRLMPDLFARHRVAPVDDYPDQLLACLRSVTPRPSASDASIVLLTPGPYNSAYYEHSFLADKLGVELVEGRDLFVDEDVVYMRTTLGPKRVDVIYRRVDDEFIDPLVFNPDSLLGAPGLVGAYLAGNVTIANAVGTGVAARFVSGYLAPRAAPPPQGLCTWAEAEAPVIGWVAFDPVRNQRADDAYVRVAVGFDALGAAPFRAAQSGGGGETVAAAVRIEQAAGQSQN